MNFKNIALFIKAIPYFVLLPSLGNIITITITITIIIIIIITITIIIIYLYSHVVTIANKRLYFQGRI